MKTLLLLLLAVGISACSSTQPSAVALGPGTTVPQTNATLVAGRSGAYVALAPRGTLTVNLESNPSAGYQWKLAEPLDANVLTLVSSPQSLLPVALAPSGPTTTQPESWVFKAVGPGTTKVRMVYTGGTRTLRDQVSYTFTVNAE